MRRRVVTVTREMTERRARQQVEPVRRPTLMVPLGEFDFRLVLRGGLVRAGRSDDRQA